MNPIKYRMQHKTMKPQTQTNEPKVEVELHRNTKQVLTLAALRESKIKATKKNIHANVHT